MVLAAGTLTVLWMCVWNTYLRQCNLLCMPPNASFPALLKKLLVILANAWCQCPLAHFITKEMLPCANDWLSCDKYLRFFNLTAYSLCNELEGRAGLLIEMASWWGLILNFVIACVFMVLRCNEAGLRNLALNNKKKPYKQQNFFFSCTILYQAWTLLYIEAMSGVMFLFYCVTLTTEGQQMNLQNDIWICEIHV